MKYFINLFISLDQLANAIAGGNPDVTISSRAGFHANNGNTFWIILSFLIDLAFYPIDGKDHCYQSYLNEDDEFNTERGYFGKLFIVLILLIFLYPIAVVLRISQLFN